MVSIAHSVLRGFRWLHIIFVVAQSADTARRTVGERITQRLVQRFARPIVLAIKRPITVAILDEIVKVLAMGNYPQNLASSLSQNRQLLGEIIAEKVKNDPQIGTLSRLPFHDNIIRSVVDATIRIILDVLCDRRIDEFFVDVVQENRRQIRLAVEQGLQENNAEIIRAFIRSSG